MSSAPPLLADPQGVLGTHQPNLTWTPQTQDERHWATLLRMPITRVAHTSESSSTTNVLSFELVLGPARRYQQDHGGPPINILQWIHDHEQRAGGLPPNFYHFAGTGNTTYSLCPA